MRVTVEDFISVVAKLTRQRDLETHRLRNIIAKVSTGALRQKIRGSKEEMGREKIRGQFTAIPSEIGF